MLYLAIDQHAKQLTVNLRDEEGHVILKRQISTRWEKVRAFFSGLRQQAAEHGGFAAILEVCGFNDWLLAMLQEYGCRATVLVQSKEHKKRKTDRIDANALGELLWVNRLRLLAGERLACIRRVEPASPDDAAARQLTALRQRLGRQRTRTVVQIHRLLAKHNLMQECPTKLLATKRARAWLAELKLSEIDRCELDLLLAQWKLWDEQLAAIQPKIDAMRQTHATAAIVSTIPGLAGYGGLAVAARIGRIERFERPAALANFWGLAPSCRNSGDTKRRLGSITKEGSSMVRFLLGQAVLHVLRRDPHLRAWYRQVKARRGSKIARVAVMRRLAETIWHMVRDNQPYTTALYGKAKAPFAKRTEDGARKEDGPNRKSA
jgi:transposase